MLILTVFAAIDEVKSKEVACESIKVATDRVKNDETTCFMINKTAIDTKDVTISTPNSSVVTLTFYSNKKISYLPVNIDKSFPNLTRYNAAFCNILEVSRNNFKGLNKLKVLTLGHNPIEKIEDESFKDLTEMTNLDLGKINY
jgi:Leucine rich repeat